MTRPATLIGALVAFSFVLAVAIAATMAITRTPGDRVCRPFAGTVTGTSGPEAGQQTHGGVDLVGDDEVDSLSGTWVTFDTKPPEVGDEVTGCFVRGALIID